MEEKNKPKKGKAAFIISVCIFIVVIFGCLLYLKMCTVIFENKVETETAPQILDDTSSGETEAELPDNPIDFAEQHEVNEEIYAWIYVPGTNVNYPILQSAVDDLYYLRRDLKGDYFIPGVIFTQSHNKKDFSDPVTVIYGHNMSEDGTMFATLHNFENKEFFDKNEFFYIYTPGHELKYRVVSAFKYDNRHIMNSFDFTKEEDLRGFFDYLVSPVMMPMQVREGITLSLDDRVVTLSTCMNDPTYRYLVNGVLVEDKLTK